MDTIIYLQIDDEEIAALISQIPHRSHSMYKVIFESGYENIFFTDVETGKWVEEDLGFTTLAKQIGEAIKKLSQDLYHVPKILTWHKQYVDGRSVLFGFFNFAKGTHKMYEIYNGNKKYMYTLSDIGNEEWQIFGNSNGMTDKIDPVLIQHIIQILPFYHTNV